MERETDFDPYICLEETREGVAHYIEDSPDPISDLGNMATYVDHLQKSEGDRWQATLDQARVIVIDGLLTVEDPRGLGVALDVGKAIRDARGRIAYQETLWKHGYLELETIFKDGVRLAFEQESEAEEQKIYDKLAGVAARSGQASLRRWFRAQSQKLAGNRQAAGKRWIPHARPGH